MFSSSVNIFILSDMSMIDTVFTIEIHNENTNHSDSFVKMEDVIIRLKKSHLERFREEVNGCGPDSVLENILANKAVKLINLMEYAINAKPGSMEGALTISFPLSYSCTLPEDTTRKNIDYEYTVDTEDEWSDNEEEEESGENKNKRKLEDDDTDNSIKIARHD